MKLIKVDSCTNCPLCSYYPTDYYRNAYFRCTKSGFDVTGNYYSGTIYERCQLENEPNSSNTVLCKGCPTDKEIRAAATDSTMHQTKTDRWAIDMMQLFFEKGARWAITKLSGSPTVGREREETQE